jgi:uncharacterized DUF497 family protein
LLPKRTITLYCKSTPPLSRTEQVSFEQARQAFDDPDRKIEIDEKHSQNELRYFCFGKVGDKVLTVRFIVRNNKIRIFGAGKWRSGGKNYEENKTKIPRTHL